MKRRSSDMSSFVGVLARQRPHSAREGGHLTIRGKLCAATASDPALASAAAASVQRHVGGGLWADSWADRGFEGRKRWKTYVGARLCED